MKKQMMTLAVCLALTATSVLASSIKATQSSKGIIPVATQTIAPKVKRCPKQNFKEKLAKDRENLYSKLGLSAEQKAKAEALHQKNRKEAEPLFAKLHSEKAKFHELKAQKACAIKIEEQKLKVKEAKNALNAHMKASRKEFEAILNKDQLTKFKAIRKEDKEQWEKGGCQQHHHHGACGHEKGSFNGPCGVNKGK